MNCKKILASLLSVATVFSAIPTIKSDVSANSVASKIPAFNSLNKKEKTVAGIGGGALLAVAVPLTIWCACEYQESRTFEGQLKKAIKSDGDFKELEFPGGHIVHLDNIFNEHVQFGNSNVAACYYGKDAFKNVLNDVIIDSVCSRSNNLFWRDNSIDQKLNLAKSGDKVPASLSGALVHFVQFNEDMWKAESDVNMIQNPVSPNGGLWRYLTLSKNNGQTKITVAVDTKGDEIKYRRAETAPWLDVHYDNKSGLFLGDQALG